MKEFTVDAAGPEPEQCPSVSFLSFRTMTPEVKFRAGFGRTVDKAGVARLEVLHDVVHLHQERLGTDKTCNNRIRMIRNPVQLGYGAEKEPNRQHSPVKM